MDKFDSWLKTILPYNSFKVMVNYNFLTPIMKIGYMMQYLMDCHGVKEFEFKNQNPFEIYDLLIDEIEKRSKE